MSFNKDNKSTRCPCKGCAEREIGCHAACEKYKTWKAEVDAAREAERKYKKSLDIISEKNKREIWKNSRWSNRTKGRK